MHCSSRGKGEAVLLIHGMPTNGRLWDGVVHELAGQFRCFTIDLPGMGETPFLPYGPAYFEQVAAQIEDVRVRHQVQKWHIVGHDGGCAVAVHYAHLFPQRAGCLALLSPAIFPDLRPFFLLEVLRKPMIGRALAPLVHALFWQVAMRRAIPAAHHEAQRKSFYKAFAGGSGPWKLMRVVRWGRPEVMLQGVSAILHRLHHPTLVVHGSRDLLPESFAMRAADQIPNAQLVTVDSGHFIPLDQAKQVARRLVLFFAAQVARSTDEKLQSRGALAHRRPSNTSKTRRREAFATAPAAQ